MLAEKIKENQGAQVIIMPKKEPYTQVLNSILIKLYSPGYHLPGEQRAVFDFILRQTSGYRRDTDQISLSQFSEALGIKKPSVIRSIKALTLKKIISVSKVANDEAKVFKINTNIEEWLSLAESLTLAKRLKVVSNTANLPLAKSLPTKEIYKENIKEIKTSSSDLQKSGGVEAIQNQFLIPQNLKNISLEEIEAEAKSPEPEKKKRPKRDSCLTISQSEKFIQFWSNYPQHRRKEKPKAEAAFKAINPNESLFDEIMQGLERSKKSYDWSKENGQFVCYPEKYLKNKKWMDEADNRRPIKKQGCPMTGYMPPEDLKAKAAEYAHLLDGEPGF